MVLDHPSARRYPPCTMMKRATVESTADAYLALTFVALERGQVQWTGESKALRDDLELRRKVLWL